MACGKLQPMKLDLHRGHARPRSDNRHPMLRRSGPRTSYTVLTCDKVFIYANLATLAECRGFLRVPSSINQPARPKQSHRTCTTPVGSGGKLLPSWMELLQRILPFCFRYCLWAGGKRTKKKYSRAKKEVIFLEGFAFCFMSTWCVIVVVNVGEEPGQLTSNDMFLWPFNGSYFMPSFHWRSWWFAVSMSELGQSTWLEVTVCQYWLNKLSS